MFSKSKTETPRTAKAEPPAPPSLISSGLTIIGDLRCNGEIQVDGEVTGDIDCARLVIGEKARVRGEVLADQVIVRGEVQGRVRGGEVELAKSARVVGDILHRTLAMEAGAHLEGQVRKVEDPRELSEAAPMPKLLQTAGSPRLEAHEGGMDRDVAG
jgi:cytoskeletal protein CcmA (bactofilin family)